MNKFYYTYGTEGQPFVGGWSIVIAPDLTTANMLFRMAHPDKEPGFLNCSSVYDEVHFKETEMYKHSNFGARAHEVIELSIKQTIGQTATFDPQQVIREYCFEKRNAPGVINMTENDLQAMSTDKVAVTSAYLYGDPDKPTCVYNYRTLKGRCMYEMNNQTYAYHFDVDCILDRLCALQSITCDKHGNIRIETSSVGSAVRMHQMDDTLHSDPHVAVMQKLVRSLRVWYKNHIEELLAAYDKKGDTNE